MGSSDFYCWVCLLIKLQKALVYLPAYWSELNLVARVFCTVRCCVAGVVYGLLAAQVAAVAGALGGLREGMLRLVGWDWIREALEGLPCD